MPFLRASILFFNTMDLDLESKFWSIQTRVLLPILGRPGLFTTVASSIAKIVTKVSSGRLDLDL